MRFLVSPMADNSAHPTEPTPGVRLQKAMAAAGIASRRASEDMIAAGRVAVNGKQVTTPGTRVDPTVDVIAVDGKRIEINTEMVTYILNKPAGVVSTMRDDHGHPDLSQYTADKDVRLFNVGRLDEATRGLLIMTNDGQLSQRLAHPSFGVSKVYLAKVRGKVRGDQLRQLREGVELEDGVSAVDRVRIIDQQADETLLEVTLHSGKNRIVRRLLAAVGHPVLDLLRAQYGPLALGGLKPGRMRQLSTVEVGQLWDATGEQGKRG